MGVKRFSRTLNVPSIIEGTSEVLKLSEISLTNAQIKALRATPVTLVAAPGAGKLAEFVGGVAILDAGANVLTETAANLAIRYKDATGVQCSQTIESTGFVDQAGDTATTILSKLDVIASKAACENQPLVLHNLGAGEIAGNAANDATMRLKILYRVHVTGW